MNNKYYTISYLVAALNKAGLNVTQWWVYEQEQKGNLKLPRSTTNFKKVAGIKKIGAVRLVNQQQIKEIIKAFVPGGRGFWHLDQLGEK